MGHSRREKGHPTDFKRRMGLNQRRLLRLRIRQGGPYREDLLVKLDGIFEELRGVPRTGHSLHNLGRRLDRVKALADGNEIGRGFRSWFGSHLQDSERRAGQ
jgi:hypothetical protein